MITAWSSILHQARDSSLILKGSAFGSLGVRQYVHELFDSHQIQPERVRLEGPANHEEFLRTYDEIDVALDTFPYNGGTTTTEAIWQGVPVLAFWGDRWVARTSASILRAANLGRFVCRDVDEYISTAIRMAASPDTPSELAELRAHMRFQLRDSPACDTHSFARNMEQLYLQMQKA